LASAAWLVPSARCLAASVPIREGAIYSRALTLSTDLLQSLSSELQTGKIERETLLPARRKHAAYELP